MPEMISRIPLSFDTECFITPALSPKITINIGTQYWLGKVAYINKWVTRGTPKGESCRDRKDMGKGVRKRICIMKNQSLKLREIYGWE